jgi:hypothetical protein
MANNPRSKPYSQFPYDSALGDQSKQCLDWIVTQLNQLVGQANVPPSQSLASFGTNVIDPTSAQIISAGSRMSSITTGLAFVAHPTSISFYWDGTNGSQPFQIYRDDNSVFGPFITGSPFTITGLSANTTYFFYPYFDETVQQIKFATIAGVAVGNPAVAFTAKNILAAQQQILRGRLTLGTTAATSGITTPNAGSTPGTAGGGGGGGGGFGGGKYSQ